MNVDRSPSINIEDIDDFNADQFERYLNENDLSRAGSRASLRHSSRPPTRQFLELETRPPSQLSLDRIPERALMFKGDNELRSATPVQQQRVSSPPRPRIFLIDKPPEPPSVQPSPKKLHPQQPKVITVIPNLRSQLKRLLPPAAPTTTPDDLSSTQFVLAESRILKANHTPGDIVKQFANKKSLLPRRLLTTYPSGTLVYLFDNKYIVKVVKTERFEPTREYQLMQKLSAITSIPYQCISRFVTSAKYISRTENIIVTTGGEQTLYEYVTQKRGNIKIQTIIDICVQAFCIFYIFFQRNFSHCRATTHNIMITKNVEDKMLKFDCVHFKKFVFAPEYIVTPINYEYCIVNDDAFDTFKERCDNDLKTFVVELSGLLIIANKQKHLAPGGNKLIEQLVNISNNYNRIMKIPAWSSKLRLELKFQFEDILSNDYFVGELNVTAPPVPKKQKRYDTPTTSKYVAPSTSSNAPSTSRYVVQSTSSRAPTTSRYVVQSASSSAPTTSRYVAPSTSSRNDAPSTSRYFAPSTSSFSAAQDEDETVVVL